ncbi:hypothetical protein [Bacteriovorax sp. Seq25_V]|uniref:hypothetical protein n=1 Tax=Bacteriovorax sp. Seq25_V TaxID=1201288 RepID=UPI00038A4FDA|nr:hypothetical protein [Bacteriovorax sp. Seq25_V]EQC46897.1 hypothetical protein M900_2649 [Bacteriovorax sp. Seq25_V]
MKKINIYTLIFSLFIQPLSFAQDEGSSNIFVRGADKVADTIEEFQGGEYGIGKNVARPLSKYLIKRAGTPGFFISKYMSYRKQMNQPICSTSAKLNHVGYMLTLTSDITNHVITWKNGRDLKKEFEGEAGELEKYAQENKLGEDKNTKIPEDKRDVHLKAIDYQIRWETLEQKRLNLYRTLKYPALGLFLTSQILTTQEMLAQASTAGSAAAAEESCWNTQKVVKEAEEKKTQGLNDAAAEAEKKIVETKEEKPTPWYLKPFMWMGEKLSSAGSYLKQKGKDIRNSDTYKTLKDHRKGKGVKSEYGADGKAKADVQTIREDNSAAYAEEMIINVIEEFKGEDKSKGIGGKLKSEAIDIGTRYAVRTMLNTQREAVDKFMRSPTGRYLVIGQNIYIIYSDFQSIEAQVKYSKEKKETLEYLKSKYTGSIENRQETTLFELEYQKIFLQVLDVIAPEVYAMIDGDKMKNELSLCISDIGCEKSYQFFSEDMKTVFANYPVEDQKKMGETLKSSYALEHFIRSQKKGVVFANYDMKKMNESIERDVKIVEENANILNDKKMIPIAQLEKSTKADFDEYFNFYSGMLRPDFNTITFEQVQKLSNGRIVKPKAKKVTLESQNVALKTESNKETEDLDLKEIEKKRFQYNILYKKDDNIWLKIHQRYKKKYKDLL